MDPTEISRPATPAPGMADSIANSAEPATASNLGRPVKSWKPPVGHKPTQTFSQFRDKVESEWRGSVLQTKSGDIIIVIPKRDLLLSTLLNELSITDGKAKEMKVFDNAGNFSIMVYDAWLRDLLDEKEEEERSRAFWLPRSVYRSL